MKIFILHEVNNVCYLLSCAKMFLVFCKHISFYHESFCYMTNVVHLKNKNKTNTSNMHLTTSHGFCMLDTVTMYLYTHHGDVVLCHMTDLIIVHFLLLSFWYSKVSMLVSSRWIGTNRDRLALFYNSGPQLMVCNRYETKSILKDNTSCDWHEIEAKYIYQYIFCLILLIITETLLKISTLNLVFIPLFFRWERDILFIYSTNIHNSLVTK